MNPTCRKFAIVAILMIAAMIPSVFSLTINQNLVKAVNITAMLLDVCPWDKTTQSCTGPNQQLIIGIGKLTLKFTDIPALLVPQGVDPQQVLQSCLQNPLVIPGMCYLDQSIEDPNLYILRATLTSAPFYTGDAVGLIEFGGSVYRTTSGGIIGTGACAETAITRTQHDCSINSDAQLVCTSQNVTTTECVYGNYILAQTGFGHKISNEGFEDPSQRFSMVAALDSSVNLIDLEISFDPFAQVQQTGSGGYTIASDFLYKFVNVNSTLNFAWEPGVGG